MNGRQIKEQSKNLRTQSHQLREEAHAHFQRSRDALMTARKLKWQVEQLKLRHAASAASGE